MEIILKVIQISCKCMFPYIYSWFTLLYSRNQYNTVKQLYSKNKVKIILKMCRGKLQVKKKVIQMSASSCLTCFNSFSHCLDWSPNPSPWSPRACMIWFLPTSPTSSSVTFLLTMLWPKQSWDHFLEQTKLFSVLGLLHPLPGMYSPPHTFT